MKKLIYLFIVISLTSCGSYIKVGSGGCGAWASKKFEKDRRHQRNYNWVNNPRSGRYRTGVH
jgi:hypothetical protein